MLVRYLFRYQTFSEKGPKQMTIIWQLYKTKKGLQLSLKVKILFSAKWKEKKLGSGPLKLLSHRLKVFACQENRLRAEFYNLRFFLLFTKFLKELFRIRNTLKFAFNKSTFSQNG